MVKKKQGEKPRIAIAEQEAWVWQESQLVQDRDDFHGGLISGTHLTGLEAERVAFSQFRFRQVTITESMLIGLELMDVVFEGCDLSNVCLSDASLHRVVFHQCKLMGTEFSGGTLHHVTFSECLADMALFRFARCKHVSFCQCSLVAADFYHADLQKSDFASCRLDQAVLSGCRLAGMDLSDSHFESLVVEVEDLQDCEIAQHQAASFAPLLGLIVK